MIESRAWKVNGFLALLLLLGLIAGSIFFFVQVMFAYATEIASAMLQRQQASAIIAARQKIVEGAVGVAQMAIEKLQQDGTVELDDERKVTMINNLMVAIVSDKAAQPVINAGSLY